jgi:SAM-dependent methyltransferase
MIYVQDGNKQERDKYAEIWNEIPEYKLVSPGLQNVDRFLKVMKPSLGETLIDIGCGQGKAGLEFEKHDLRVWYLDITRAGILPEVNVSKFIEKPIWGDWKYPVSNFKFDYGFSCDVLEHIPPEYTMLCLDRIIKNCRISWLQIALVEDGMGDSIGEKLHMTVRPFDWWLTRLATLGNIIEARDLLEQGLYVVSK